jgi:hypothetical protein
MPATLDFFVTWILNRQNCNKENMQGEDLAVDGGITEK